MRIISGQYRSRIIEAPPGLNTRPTSGRVREALFSHLQAAILDDGFDGLRVLDLFAGSGALGIEALSRGASHVTFVDADPIAARTVRKNLEALRCQAADVLEARVPGALARLGQPAPYDLIFVDPPYAATNTAEVLETLVSRTLCTPAAIAVWELDVRSKPAQPHGWTVRSDRRYGDTRVLVLQRVNDDEANEEPSVDADDRGTTC
jgi:16S rRNA (guanine966-N2)-methyltransferase